MVLHKIIIRINRSNTHSSENKMVLLNYQNFIKERLEQIVNTYSDKAIVSACSSQCFTQLLVKLYEYCQEINIIEQRMKILAEQTQKIKGMKPKLLDSEKIKVNNKTKQISSVYSIFLMKQKKFKVLSDESAFYQHIYKIILNILEKCFDKKNFCHLNKEINRLLRTNTFNKKLCWNQFIQVNHRKYQSSQKKRKFCESDFRTFRRSILSQKSDIRPYVNNKSCFRSKFTRSPIITLLYPNNEYMEFNLRQRTKTKSFWN